MRASFAIARNTFVEVVRQPAYSLITCGTLLGYALSPYLAMFALRDDANLLKDFGVSTIFLSGLLLAAAGASAMAGKEGGDNPALTILSKPVGRASFVLGRLAGVLAALGAAGSIFTLALLLAARQGPPRGAHQPVDWPAAAALWGALLLTLALAAVRSLRRSRRFGAALLGAALLVYPLLTLSAAFLDGGWRLQPVGRGFDPLLVAAAVLALFGVFVIGALAVVLSLLLRKGAVLGTIIVFVAGLALGSDTPWWLFFIPDLQLFWVGDLFYRPASWLPAAYVVEAGVYALAYSLVWLSLGIWAFGRRGVS